MKHKPDTSRPTLNDDDSYMESEFHRLARIMLITVIALSLAVFGMGIYLLANKSILE